MTRLANEGARHRIAIVHLTTGNGLRVAAHEVTCDKCGAKEQVVSAGRKELLPVDIAIKQLKNKGWTIERRNTICPNHRHRKPPRLTYTTGPERFPVELPLPRAAIGLSAAPFDRDIDLAPGSFTFLEEPIVAENVESLPTPTVPTRDQKRRIHDEIAGNWDDKAGRYIGNASDQFIADGLHVPRAWVSEIRADFFGDEGSNEEIAAMRTALNIALDDVDKLVENSMGLAQSFEEISKSLKAMSTRLERIEKSVLPKR
jgi:hypothetical protein